MTIPLLLLAIYAGILAASLALFSYNRHAHPAPESVSRVADAVERAVIAQLASPAKWSAGFAVVSSVVAGFVAHSTGMSLLWSTLVPPVVALITFAALFVAARSVQRGISQTVAMLIPGQALVHDARTTLGAVLLCGTTTFGVTLGAHALSCLDVGANQARFVALLGACMVAGISMILARAAATSALTAERGASDADLDPNGASLAVLAGNSFLRPLLVLSAWSVVSAVGQSTLVLALPAEGQSWLYPHLLQLLALLSLVFGAWVARSTNGETNVSGWVRAGLVTLVLLIASCWSLSSQLPVELARSVPAGLTFFFLSLSVFVFVTPSAQLDESSLGRNADRFLSLLMIGILVGVLVLSLSHSETAQMSGKEVSRLIVGGALAALPLIVCWSICSNFDGARHSIARLAFIEPAVDGRSGNSTSNRLLGLLPILCVLVILGSLHLRAGGVDEAPSLMQMGFSILLGLIFAATGSSLVERGSDAFETHIRQLLKSNRESPRSVDLESASQVCAGSIARRTWLWLSVVLSPPFLCIVLQSTLAPGIAAWSAWGVALGVALFGSGHAWMLHHCRAESMKMFGTMSLVTCLAQVLLIFMVTGAV